MAIIKVKTGGITADAVTDALIADDVVGTEHLTANEVDTTALGADAVTGAQLADDAVNSEHYTDGSVDTAHIADAQITTAKLSTAVLTGATDIGAAIADADLFLVDDGAGGTLRKTAASRIKTYTTPSQAIVYAQGNSGTSCSDNTITKIELENEIIDTASLMASSRFTVTADYQGKYLAMFQLSFNHTATAKLVQATIRKNNTEIQYAQIHSAKGSNHTVTVTVAIITDMTTNDYLEFWGKHDTGSTKSSNGSTATNVKIFKIN